MEFCRDTQLYLSLKLDGMLEPEEVRALEAHLAQCPRCRALERELSAIHTALPELEEYEAPEGFARGVMERVAALEQKPKVMPLFRRPQVRALMGLAACAVLCVGLYRAGLFDQSGVNLDAVVYSDAEASAGQSEETEIPGVLQAEQPLPEDGGAQPRDMTPDAEPSEAAPSTQESSGADGVAQPDKQQAAPADADTEQPGVQPSQFQVTAQQAEGFAAAQTAGTVLTLDRLPQGWEEVLGQTPQWFTDEEGRTCCTVTAQQLEQLEELARQQGITAALGGRAEEEQSCLLTVLQAP